MSATKLKTAHACVVEVLDCITKGEDVEAMKDPNRVVELVEVATKKYKSFNVPAPPRKGNLRKTVRQYMDLTIEEREELIVEREELIVEEEDEEEDEEQEDEEQQEDVEEEERSFDGSLSPSQMAGPSRRSPRRSQRPSPLRRSPRRSPSLVDLVSPDGKRSPSENGLVTVTLKDGRKLEGPAKSIVKVMNKLDEQSRKRQKK